MAKQGLTEADKRKLFEEEVLKIGLDALRRAKRKAPVDTGRLRASITLADTEGLIQPIEEEAKEGDGVDTPRGEYVLRLGSNVEYSDDQEFGTVNMPANPFLRPSVSAALARFGYEQS